MLACCFLVRSLRAKLKVRVSVCVCQFEEVRSLWVLVTQLTLVPGGRCLYPPSRCLSEAFLIYFSSTQFQAGCRDSMVLKWGVLWVLQRFQVIGDMLVKGIVGTRTLLGCLLIACSKGEWFVPLCSPAVGYMPLNGCQS